MIKYSQIVQHNTMSTFIGRVFINYVCAYVTFIFSRYVYQRYEYRGMNTTIQESDSGIDQGKE